MNYIKRHTNGIQVDNKTIEEGLLSYVNHLCISHGSTYTGRRDAARVLLKRTQCVPIYVDTDIIFIMTHSLRHIDCVFVNENQIASYFPNKAETTIQFLDGSHIEIQLTIQQTKRLIDQVKTLRKRLNDL